MGKADDALSAERLRQLVSYDPETGVFTAIARRHLVPVGTVLGGPDCYRDVKGYIRIGISGFLYLGHRLAWLHAYGGWPKDQIDHVNHIRDDNRLCNLRECTNAENRQNIRPEGYGISGYLGVYLSDHKSRPWMAKIILKQKVHHLGFFGTPEQASAAYLAKKQEVHRFAATGVSELGAA